MAQLEWKKESSKSASYEIGVYQITVPISNKYIFMREQHKPHLDVIDENESMIPCFTVTIKNMKSDRKTTKRCVQDRDTVLEDLERDYNGKRTTFRWPLS